jgi:3-oxoacyl-[acyl-carrier protein] reductase
MSDRMTVAVTGAGSGVGAATAQKFFAAGHRVALLDRNEDAVRRVAAELDPTGENALPLRLDVTDEVEAARAVRAIGERCGALDVLVNNAGAPHAAIPFEQIGQDTWQTVLGVNVLGIAIVTAAALPLLKASASAAVVNVTSVAGVRARPGLSAYCASKAAAISLTETLALELANDRIRVNAIAPGALDTPMFTRFLKPGESIEHGVARYEPGIPLGRLGDPGEIADAVLWASGAESAFMTGQTIVIDGGRAI